MKNEAEARRLVAEAGRMLLAEGLVARTWGNVSCRADEGVMLITPSGMDYESMSEGDVVPFDMASGTWTGARRPSSEHRIHSAAYRVFPEAEFVIHTHQTYASALALTGLASLPLTERERAMLGGVAHAPYALPGTKELANNVEAAFASGAHTVLMARHGVVVAGRDREEAFSRAKLLEETCRRACRGQPEGELPFDAPRAERLLTRARKAFGHAALEASAPALACAALGGNLPAQLDDAAQMIGSRIPAAKPEEKAVLRALRWRGAALVPGVGAVCRARDEGDCRALCLLIKKACICFLHARALGANARLSLFDTALMRVIYIRKYQKKIGG